MYINAVIYKVMIADELKKESISDRVKKYLLDLYKRYQYEVDMDMFQWVYSYDQMGKCLLHDIQKTGDLTNADTFLFPAWGVSWNMDFAVHALHWKRLFALSAELVDVRDCGSLCVYYAVHIMLKLHASKSLKNALIGSVENAWLFCKNKIKSHAPTINYMGSFQCSNDNKFNHSLEIVCCQISNVLSLVKINFQLKNIINRILIKHNVTKNNCSIWIRNDDAVLWNKEWKLISHPVSSGFLYYCIDLILKNENENSNLYFLIVDFDPSRLSIGAILLRRLSC